MTVDLKTLRVGDTIIFADGTKGVCSVCYNNGGAYFTRWDVYDEAGNKRGWSGSDSYCCSVGIARNGRRGHTNTSGEYVESPGDIIEIVKPTLEELQDEIARLKALMSTNESKDEARK